MEYEGPKMRKHDQQGTPFSQNIRDLWCAILGKPRTDDRTWLFAVGHEFKNVLVELVRANPEYVLLILLILCIVLTEHAFTGTFL